MHNQQHPTTRFRAVLEQHPQLHLLGYGPAPHSHSSPTDLAAQRAALHSPHALQQAAAAVQWIETRLQPCSPRRRRLPSSYTAKHVMQTETGQHVYNGAFILAALTAGLDLDTRHYNPRVHAALRTAATAEKVQVK